MGMSARTIGLWLPPLVLMGVIFFLSHQPSLDSGLGWIDFVGRKVLHFAEYALLCFLWWRPLATLVSPARAAALAFAIASGFAITDEYHQSFIEGRNGSPIDWAIDAAGAAAAALRLRKARTQEKLAA